MRFGIVAAGAWFAAGAAGGCRSAPEPEAPVADSPTESAKRVANSPIRPIGAAAHLDARRVALGRRLFEDVRLSHDNSVACVTCHMLERGGIDGRAHAIGIEGKVGDLNTPTVFNASLNFRQFWDGRAETLEAQVEAPLHNPIEMGSSFVEATGKLARDPTYAREVRATYGVEALTATVMSDAIASFERSLVLPGSRFDRYLAGDDLAIDADEQHGYELFLDYGCASCHQGANVGGNMFERFGVAQDYFAGQAHPTKSDLGRYNITQREEDRYVFRVPSLRLVSLTPPYFHDGSIQSLEQAIRLMARYQIGRELTDHDVLLIGKFLGTLVGISREVTFAAFP